MQIRLFEVLESRSFNYNCIIKIFMYSAT